NHRIDHFGDVLRIYLESSSAVYADQNPTSSISFTLHHRRIEEPAEIVSLISKRAMEHHNQRRRGGCVVTPRHVQPIRKDLSIARLIGPLELSALSSKRILPFAESR